MAWCKAGSAMCRKVLPGGWKGGIPERSRKAGQKGREGGREGGREEEEKVRKGMGMEKKQWDR